MINLLVKFGAEDHMRQMQKEGLLYCKSVLDFAKMENDSARGDKYENTVQLKVLIEKEIWLKPNHDKDADWKRLDITHGQQRLSDNEFEGNLFCMSCFPILPELDKSEINISDRFLKEFGNHYLLILNQPEFFRRLDMAFRKMGVSYQREIIKYSDLKNFSGNKSIFVKDNLFSCQSEYRIFIKTDKTELQVFKIGSIEDITHLGKLSESTAFEVKKAPN